MTVGPGGARVYGEMLDSYGYTVRWAAGQGRPFITTNQLLLVKSFSLSAVTFLSWYNTVQVKPTFHDIFLLHLNILNKSFYFKYKKVFKAAKNTNSVEINVVKEKIILCFMVKTGHKANCRKSNKFVHKKTCSWPSEPFFILKKNKDFFAAI